MGKQDVTSLENDIAQTRERLSATIDELVYRASPKTIAKREVDTVKGFFVDENGPRQDNIIKVAAGVGGFVLVLVVLRKITR